MRKINKSLAVLLSVLMLASFLPIFASAAIALTPAKCVLLEAPKLSYKGGEASSDLVVPGGTSHADLTVVGGRVSYEGTEIEGKFLFQSSVTGSPSTVALSVGEITVRLYFHPTDTVNFSRGQWRSTDSAPLEGWPKLTVDGLDATIVTPPAVSSDLLAGYKLNTLTLSGGLVKDAEGNDVTSLGKWTFVNATTIPTESGPQEIQWKATGYDVLKTTVNVNVTTIKTTLVENPVPSMTRTSAFLFDSPDDIFIKAGSGKVIDADGNDITAIGTWTAVANMTDTVIMKDTEVDVVWSCKGYEDAYGKMTVLVGTQYSSNLKITKFPEFKITSDLGFIYIPNKTVADYASITSGEMVDENGNIVEGTWGYYVNGHPTDSLPENISVGPTTYLLISTFVPNDTTLPKITHLIKSQSFTVSKAEFELSEDFEIVLNYGAYFDQNLDSDKELRFSTIGTVPEDAGIKNVFWSRTVFDPQTADYGTVTYVTAKITPASGYYKEKEVSIPVRIQNFIHDNAYLWYIDQSNLSFTSTPTEMYDGIRKYKINFPNKRLKGTVDLIVNDEVVVSVSPDENGRFYAEGQWLAPASGDYSYKFEYKPTDEDTATVMNPTVEGTFNMDIRPYHTMTVIVGEQTFTYTERVGEIIYVDWDKTTGLTADDFRSWVFTDAEGNAYTPVAVKEGTDLTQTANIHIKMGDCDFTATMKDTSIIGGDSVESIFDKICSFFRMIIDWFTGIFNQIKELFAEKV
ncbi:MAG: hypothetical protein IJO14_05175 [Clostridia bacterium]|nr:hypothetical protein [Clostridia bacterium]